MTPLEMAETLEARAIELASLRIVLGSENRRTLDRSVLALRGAADMLRQIHRHEMKASGWDSAAQEKATEINDELHPGEVF